MGAQVDIDDDGMTASAPDGLRAAAVQTDVHPGFMTDWQTPLMVLFTQAEGMSVLHETVYEDRFVYVPALQAMGGEIELFRTCLGGPACRFHDTEPCTPRWCGGCPSCTGRRGRDPRRAGRVLQRHRRGRGRRAARCISGVSTTSSGATTARPSSSGRWA